MVELLGRRSEALGLSMKTEFFSSFSSFSGKKNMLLISFKCPPTLLGMSETQCTSDAGDLRLFQSV